jgi:diaminopimelate decarboxylase
VTVDLVRALIRRHFGVADGQLCVGGAPVAELAQRFGTPLFVYDRAVLDAQLALLRDALPPDFAVYYSVKANPNPWIIRHFLARGCGAEVASAGEFQLAVRAGCPPRRIFFAGPGKRPDELEEVIAAGIGEIHVESLLEIRRVADIARSRGVRVTVSLRVNPTEEAQGGALRMGGKPSPFGIDEEALDAAVEQVLASPWLVLAGVHLFAGTQILDHAVLARQCAKGLQVARRVGERLGRPLATLDFGGGLGIPYFAGDRPLDMTKLGEVLAAVMASVAGDPLFEGTRFVVEPGRFLVGEAGIYVTRVLDVKTSRGKTFVVVDGGMNHHLAAAGHLGQALRRTFPVAVLNRIDDPARQVVDVTGPLCTPLDILARGVELGPVAVGDLIGVFQSGAYARSASPLNFLSHPSPPEVLVDRGDVQLIRRRGFSDDLVADVP